MSLLNAIDAYHALLTNEVGELTQAQLSDQLKRRGLYFGERPLMSVLRPRFMAPEQYRFLEERVVVLLSAFGKTHRAAMADAEFRKQFALYDWEETLIADDPGFADPSPLSRLDAFFVHERGGLRFTEYNAETPAGAAYNDVLGDVVFGLPVLRDFLRDFSVRPLPVRPYVLNALLGAYEEFSGRRGATPRIAILDWLDVPTRHEFVLSADFFAQHGIECVIADPRSAEYRNGKLYVEDAPVDLIYKRVLISELIERCGIDSDVVKAVRARAVCMVNPFRCKILHKKLSLAVLSDERNHHLFNGREVEYIQAHVPWTRRVEERKTEYHGDVVDLLEFVSRQRERFVLKPNDEYGGKGIVLGWLVSDDEWQDALRDALNDSFIVQERIELPIEKYPVFTDGEVRI